MKWGRRVRINCAMDRLIKSLAVKVRMRSSPYSMTCLRTCRTRSKYRTTWGWYGIWEYIRPKA